jgi:hypothetical protein
MGQTTPNMSIYVPSNNETGYAQSFAAGMTNVDQHDHSGPPNKGVPIASGGIADGSIVASKLNSNVLTVNGGLAFDINNAIKIAAPVTIAQGGTASTSFGTINGVVKYDGTQLVASTSATYDASNVYTNTAQPAFSYLLSATQNNKTGNGTQYQLGQDALTKIFDQGNNFNTDGTFTAPVNGIYQLNVQVGFTNGSTVTKINIIIYTTNREYHPMFILVPSTSGDLYINATVLADMNAGNTAIAKVACTGHPAGDDVGIKGDATNVFTGVQGFLVC